MGELGDFDLGDAGDVLGGFGFVSGEKETGTGGEKEIGSLGGAEKSLVVLFLAFLAAVIIAAVAGLMWMP